jgi:hypothetical protein
VLDVAQVGRSEEAAMARVERELVEALIAIWSSRCTRLALAHVSEAEYATLPRPWLLRSSVCPVEPTGVRRPSAKARASASTVSGHASKASQPNSEASEADSEAPREASKASNVPSRASNVPSKA